MDREVVGEGVEDERAERGWVGGEGHRGRGDVDVPWRYHGTGVNLHQQLPTNLVWDNCTGLNSEKNHFTWTICGPASFTLALTGIICTYTCSTSMGFALGSFVLVLIPLSSTSHL